jgi:hypothetical protein
VRKARVATSAETDDDGDLAPAKSKTRRMDDEPEQDTNAEEPKEEAAADEEPDVDPEVIDSKRTVAKVEQPRGKLTPTANKQRDLDKNRSTQEEEDEDELPEEEKDAAPPAKELPKRRVAAENGDSELPPVERKGKYSDALASRISRIKSKE